jgi:hypothetical protein
MGTDSMYWIRSPELPETSERSREGECVSNPKAYLYGPKGLISGVAGVLAEEDAAIFSPWPAKLGYKNPFAVRIIVDGVGDAWALPSEVHIPRLDGAAERNNVAMVRLLPYPAPAVERGAQVSEQDIIDALQTQNPRAALPSLGPDRFGGLGARSRSLPPIGGSGAGGTRPQATALPETVLVTNGPPKSVAFSICRIFRWD